MLDNPRFIFLIVLVAVMSAIMYYDRKNVQRVSILFYRRTKKGLDIIDNIARKAPRFWNIYGWVGVVAGILSIFISLALIGYGIYDLTDGGEQGGVGLVLPGLSGESSFTPGAFFIPIEYWIISIGIIMFVHELSHGIVARTEDFEINSVGWIVLGVIPGAFVEPKGENMLPGAETEEKENNNEEHHGPWDQGNWKSQLKVLCAGSFANYLTAALFLVLFLGASSAFLADGLVYEAQEDSPAAEAGLTSGTIYSLNNVSIEDTQAFSEEILRIQPGDRVNVSTSEGEFSAIAEPLDEEDSPEVQEQLRELGIEERGAIGLSFEVMNVKEEYSNYSGGIQWAINLLEMIFLLNLAIGLFNMLPIKPLDGGQTVDVLAREFVSEDSSKYVNYLSLAGWIIVIGSVLFGLIFI